VSKGDSLGRCGEVQAVGLVLPFQTKTQFGDLAINVCSFLFLRSVTAPSGPGLSDYPGFTITLRHTTIGRTPLDKWSVRRRNLYLTSDKHPCHRRDWNPQSQQASGRRPTP